MDNTLLQDLKIANEAITRFVSEISARPGGSGPQSRPVRLAGIRDQLNKIQHALGSVAPPGLRADDLDKELTTYAVNLGLLKKAIEELGPSLEKEMRLAEATISRLRAANDWSASLKVLSR